MKVIFNSSLPRSGSTLIQNLLAQNPAIYATATSGVIELLFAARAQFTQLDEFKLQDAETMKKGWLGFCRGGLEGFYANLTDRPIISEKSRGWNFYYSWTEQFYPNPKIICCVRDARAIVASMEKLHRKNMHLHDPADNPAQMQMVSIESRVNHWLNTPPVGLGFDRLRDAVGNGNAAKFHFVQYTDLTEQPEATFRALYEYIGEPYYEHDFNDVQQLVPENDAVHGSYGDHQIRPIVTPVVPDWESYLGKPICDALEQQYGWITKL